MARTPDNYMVPKKKKDQQVGLEGLAPIREDAKMTMGNDNVDLVYRGPGPQRSALIPNHVEGSSPGKGELLGSTRNVGFANPEAEALKKTLLRQRQQIIQRALNSNDQNERQGLIGQRRQLESDIRPLDAATPKSFVTPEGAKAGQDRLRLQAQTEIARRQAAGPAPEPAEPLYKTPEAFRMGPNADPRDAMRAKAMYRLAGESPTLETDPLTGPRVTTPNAQEATRSRDAMARKKMELDRMKPPEFAPIDPTAMDARFEQAQGAYEKARPEADAVVARNKAETAHRQAMALKQQELETAAASADVAQQQARGAGTDAAGIEQKIRQAELQTRLQQSQRGAATESARIDPESIQTNTAMLQGVLGPIFGKGGLFQAELGKIGNMVGQGAIADAVQRVSGFESTIVNRIEQLAEADPVGARDLAAAVIAALPPTQAGGVYDGSVGGPAGSQLADSLNRIRQRLQVLMR